MIRPIRRPLRAQKAECYGAAHGRAFRFFFGVRPHSAKMPHQLSVHRRVEGVELPGILVGRQQRIQPYAIGRQTACRCTRRTRAANNRASLRDLRLSARVP